MGKQRKVAGFALDFELIVQDEDLDCLSPNTINGHGFRRRWGIHEFHVSGQVFWLKADGDLIASDCPEIDGLGNGLTPEKVTVGPEALFPFHQVFYPRYDYNFGHI